MNDFSTVWTTIFGVYQPIVTTLSDGTEIVTTDWGYVCRVAFVVVICFCILKIVGGFIRGKQ